jgi:hypothetical protein
MEKQEEKQGEINKDPKYERPIWYLEGPFYRYEQDVKRLAAKHGVRIIDAAVTADRAGAATPEQTPKVTLRPEYRPKPKEEPAKEPAKK